MPAKLILSKIRSSPFARNVLVLASGTGMANVIQVAASPITRRLYSPEEYGLYSLVISISAICVSVVMGRYEMGIMLPKVEKRAIYLCWLSFTLAIISSFILLLAVLIFKDTFAQLLRSPKIENWLFLVPIIVIGDATYRILYNFNNRIQNYKDISKTQLIRAIALVTISIGLGFAFKDSEAGLMIAGTTATFLGIGMLKKTFFARSSYEADYDSAKLRDVAKEYSKFPKFSVWAGLANTCSNHLLDIFISITFGGALLGQYSLTKLVCGIPSLVLGTALSQVFYQRIVQEKNKRGDCKRVFLQTIKTLTFISLLVFGLIYLVAEPAINFVFSDKWGEAGTFATILIPFYAIRFVSSSVGTTTSAFERQELTLAVNSALFISLLMVMGAKVYFDWSITQALTAYAVVYSLNYLVFIFVFWQIIKNYQHPDDQPVVETPTATP